MQRIASGAAAAMSSLLRGLLGYYPCDEAAAVGFLPGTEVEGVPTEAWISIDGRVPASLAEDMRPTWHVATVDEVGCLHALPPRCKISDRQMSRLLGYPCHM